MLVIRMQRVGRRNKAQFRLVLQEKTQAPKSAAKEILGSYNPHISQDRKEQITLKEDRIKYWLSQGAQPSTTVHNMLLEFSVIEGEKRRSVQPKPKKSEDDGAEDEKAAAPAEDGEQKAKEAPQEDTESEKKAE